MQGRAIGDDEVLTQHGVRLTHGTFRFRNRLRADKEPPELDMSLILGEVTPNEAGAIRFRGPRTAKDLSRDAVRTTTAGTLRAAGFVVFHTPRRLNRRHVSVYRDEQWDDVVAMKFDRCFGRGVGVDG